MSQQRTFTDKHGVRWSVMEETERASPIPGLPLLVADSELRLLRFTSEEEARILAPSPESWFALSDAELAALCSRAERMLDHAVISDDDSATGPCWDTAHGSRIPDATEDEEAEDWSVDAECVICTRCGHVGPPRRITPGGCLLEGALWLLAIVPGLVYSLWRLASRYSGCQRCLSADVIPVDSPEGRRWLAQRRKAARGRRREIGDSPVARDSQPRSVRRRALLSREQVAASETLATELERLAALRDRGLLSDDEFAAAKRRLIDLRS